MRREGEKGKGGADFLGHLSSASSSGEIRAEMIGEKIIQFRGPRGNGNLERR